MRRGGNNRANPLGIALPIIIAVIVLIIIVRVFIIGTNNTGSKTNENSTVAHALVTPKPDAKMSIYMSVDASKEVTGPTKLYSEDKMVRVTTGEGDITIEGSTSKIGIEALSEVRYAGKLEGKETIGLDNGYGWIDSPNGDLKANLKYFAVDLSPGAIAIISQTTRASNLYVLKGEANVKSGTSTAILRSGQMLTILLSESNTPNLGDKIAPLDDFIKQSGMFTRRGGAELLLESSKSPIETGTGSTTGTGEISPPNVTQGANAISISYPEDEMTVDTDIIAIEGTISGNSVAKISFNGREAKILATDKSFILKDFALKDASTDILYRVTNTDGVIIQKGVLTVNLSTKKPTIKKPDVVSFPVSSKDFTIVFPSSNPYKTTEESVKIRGSFAKDIVKYIRVNSYQLQQFKPYSTNWTYNASIINGNMEEGVNEYLISYYGSEDNLLISSKLYIVKEKAPAAPTPPTAPAPVPVTASTVTPVVPVGMSATGLTTSTGSTR